MCEFRVSGFDRLAVNFADLRSDESARQPKGSGSMWPLLRNAIGGVSDGKWLPKTSMRSLAQDAAGDGEGAASMGSMS
jgi:hypothetical protein